MSNRALDRAAIEKRIVRIAVRWAKIGKGWLFNSDFKPSDAKLAVKLENAVVELNEARRRRRK